MKKLLCLFVCTIMLFSLISCEISHTIGEEQTIGSEYNNGKITFGQNVITGALTPSLSVKETSGGDWLAVNDTYDLVANVNWEPGYTVARTIKIANDGVLAFNWKLSFNFDGEFTELADYIDVYVKSGKDVYPESRDDLSLLENYGTLSSFTTLGGGVLQPEESDFVTIVFKMQEDAPASLQNLDLGAKASVIVATTQVVSESDSFNSAYQQ